MNVRYGKWGHLFGGGISRFCGARKLLLALLDYAPQPGEGRSVTEADGLEKLCVEQPKELSVTARTKAGMAGDGKGV